jgi:hypothetical protein
LQELCGSKSVVVENVNLLDRALRFCDETCVVEFILALCDCGLFVVTAFLYSTVILCILRELVFTPPLAPSHGLSM